jgi:LPS-assembly lipoprotein
MSLSRPLAALLAAAQILGACGFTPLYRRDRESASFRQMSAIDVPAVDDRLSQLVRNHLLDLISPEGRPARPLYRLSFVATESQGGVLLTRSDVITRYNMNVSVTYKLVDAQTGDELLTESIASYAAYSVLRAEFASLVAEEDARARAARDIGEQIRIRLAVYFTRREQDAAGDRH